MNTRVFPILLLLLLQSTLHAQYNPEAGRIASYGESALLRVSSGANAENIRDNNHFTFWESDSPLPVGYISRPELNALHRLSIKTEQHLRSKALDGDIHTMEQYNEQNNEGLYWLEIRLDEPLTPILLSIKAQVVSHIQIYGIAKNEEVTELGRYSMDENYSLKTIKLPVKSAYVSLVIAGREAFGLFTLAALQTLPYEYIEYDFGKQLPVGQIYSRHLNGEHVRQIWLMGAADDGKWFYLARLDPNAIPMLAVTFEHEHLLRKIRIFYTLDPEPYAKAVQWEFKVYDRHGPFGPPYPMPENTKPLAERLGINGIWGWGNNTYSDHLPEGEGPFRYNQLATKARNYHEMLWDIEKPGQQADYAKMASGGGTAANDWLNWDREYSHWQQAGFEVSASVMFHHRNLPQPEWGNVYDDAFQYAHDFAAHFGQKGLVQLVEAGNEPWDYPTGFYPVFLEGFAQGAKQGSDKIKVIPAALQAGFPMYDGHAYNNYIGDNITATALPLLDGLNVHLYSHTFNSEGVRIGIHPESRRSGMHGIRNMIRYRDANLPGKPVHVTEFGYDSKGATEDCPHSECVSEMQQAAWGVRAALMLLRYGAEDVFWYFFANEYTAPALHARSGLTGSVNTGFKPKLAYYAFTNLMKLLGEYYLQDILYENEEAMVYRFRNKNSGAQKVIAWRPVGGNPELEQLYLVQLPARPTAYTRIDGAIQVNWLPLNAPDSLVELPLSGVPVVIRF